MNNMVFQPVPAALRILTAICLLLLQACASTPNQGSPVYYHPSPQERPRSFTTVVSDSVVLARIKKKLFSDDLVDQGDVEIAVRHGVVYLTGIARDDYHRRMVVDLIRSVEGVTRIENRLHVTHRGTTFETEEGMIAGKIKMDLLRDPDIGPQPIVVEATPSHIILSGSVTSQAQKQKAAAIAEFSAGDRQVINQIAAGN